MFIPEWNGIRFCCYVIFFSSSYKESTITPYSFQHVLGCTSCKVIVIPAVNRIMQFTQTEHTSVQYITWDYRGTSFEQNNAVYTNCRYEYNIFHKVIVATAVNKTMQVYTNGQYISVQYMTFIILISKTTELYSLFVKMSIWLDGNKHCQIAVIDEKKKHNKIKLYYTKANLYLLHFTQCSS